MTSPPLWSHQTFESLYRNAVSRLIRWAEFQRTKQQSKNATTILSPRHEYPERTQILSNDNLSGSNSEYSNDADKVYEMNQIRHSWELLCENCYLFIYPLGHKKEVTHHSLINDEKSNPNKLTTTAPDNNLQEKHEVDDINYITGTPKPDKAKLINYQKFLSTCGSRNPDFGTHQLFQLIDTEKPSLFRVDVDSKNTADVEFFNNISRIQFRQFAICSLVDKLSHRLNLHQIECLYLIFNAIEKLCIGLPDALGLESCMETKKGVLTISQLGYTVIDQCSFAYRREQLYMLLCLQDLALDLYPLDEVGVSMTEAVGLTSFSFFYTLLQNDFLCNAIAALKFLLFESTRQNVHLATENVNEDDASSRGLYELVDRLWSRRLAHMLIRVLFIIVARFHPPPEFVLEVGRLLSGSVFLEQAIVKVQNEEFDNKPKSSSMLPQSIVTSKDFDNHSTQDSLYIMTSPKTESSSVILDDLTQSLPTIDMTASLTLLFLNMVDGKIIKWLTEVRQNAKIRPTSIDDIDLPTATVSSWFQEPNRNPKVAWLQKKALEHDLEPFFCAEGSYKTIVQFAICVAYSQNSGKFSKNELDLTDSRQLQKVVSLDENENIFSLIQVDYLDRLSGTTPVSRLAIQTIHSLVQQTLLPANLHWNQILRLEKISRSSKPKFQTLNPSLLKDELIFFMYDFQEHSSLEFIIVVLNRLCSFKPSASSIYVPIFFSLVNSFSWLDLAVKERRVTRNSNFNTETPFSKTPFFTSEKFDSSVNEVPSITGVGIPSEYVLGNNSEWLESYVVDPNQESALDLDQSEEVRLSPDDVQFLLPLFIRLIEFATTLCGVGSTFVATQVATKLTIQPSLLGFYLPNTLSRLENLFHYTYESDLLHRQILYSVQHIRGQKALMEKDEIYDEEELQLILTNKFECFKQSVLVSIRSIFSFFISVLSPRLYLSPAVNSTHSFFTKKRMYTFASHLFTQKLSTENLDLSVNLLHAECVIFDGLAALFRFDDSLATNFYDEFYHLSDAQKDHFNIITIILSKPVVSSISEVSKEVNSNSCSSDAEHRSVAAKWSISYMTYLVSLLSNYGYRTRYIKDPKYLLHIQLTINFIIPLLHNSSIDDSKLSALDYWALVCLVFRLFHILLKGPLPEIINENLIHKIVQNNFYEDSAEFMVTAWLMQAILTIDSFILTAILHLTRIAWQKVLSPWDAAECPEKLSQLQSVELGLEILKILFQRDIVFLSFWDALEKKKLNSETSYDLQPTTGLMPIHEHLFTYVIPSKITSQTDTNDEVQQCVFLFEFVLSEKHRFVRHLGLYLLLQMASREPKKLAILLHESPYHLATLQMTLATVIRDMELDNFERWEMLNNLGLTPSIDFYVEGMPNVYLNSMSVETLCNNNQDVSNIDYDCNNQNAFTQLNSLEMIVFQDEIAQINLQSSQKIFNNFTAYRCPIFSRYTGLPIHKKLSVRIMTAETISFMATDKMAWSVACKNLRISKEYQNWFNAAYLTDLTCLFLPNYLPVIGSISLNSPEYEEAILLLETPGSQIEEKQYMNLLCATGYVDAVTSRLLCLQLLRTGFLNKDLPTDVPPVAFQLMGLKLSSAEGTSEPVYTTQVPLLYITSPFSIKDNTSITCNNELQKQEQNNIWQEKELLVLDSLFLLIESVDEWMLGEPQEILEPNMTYVEDIISNPINYTPEVYRLYFEAIMILMTLNIIKNLLLDNLTLDLAMYIIFARLPHRHTIMYQLLASPFHTSPPILKGINKLITAEWTSILAHESFYCLAYSARSFFNENKLWPFAEQPVMLRKTRKIILQNQCRQTIEGARALFQGISGSKVNEDFSREFQSSSKSPKIICFLLNYLVAFEQMRQKNGKFAFNADSDVLKTLPNLERYCSVPINFFSLNETSQGSVLNPTNTILFKILDPENWGSTPEYSELMEHILPLCYEQNIRSIIELTAKNVIRSVVEIIAVCIHTLVIDVLSQSSSSVLVSEVNLLAPSVPEISQVAETALIDCLMGLESPELTSFECRYALVSTLGLICQLLIAVNTSFEEESEQRSIFNQKRIESYIERLLLVIVSNKGVDRIVRNRLYVTILELLQLIDPLSRTEAMQNTANKDPELFVEVFRLILRESTSSVVLADKSTNENKILSWIHILPELQEISVNPNALLLKLCIECYTQMRQMDLQNFSEDRLLPGHFLTIHSSDLWNSNELLHSINQWVQNVLNSIAVFQQDTLVFQTTLFRTNSFDWGVITVQLIFSCLYSLFETPSLCDAILAPSSPFTELIPSNSLAHPDTPPCKTIIFSNPFLPKRNTPFSHEDFGFITLNQLNQMMSRGVAVLPVFLVLFNRLVDHVQKLDLVMVINNLGEEGTEEEEVSAIVLLFRWWLARDRVFISCFDVFNHLLSNKNEQKREEKQEKVNDMLHKQYWIVIQCMVSTVSIWKSLLLAIDEISIDHIHHISQIQYSILESVQISSRLTLEYVSLARQVDSSETSSLLPRIPISSELILQFLPFHEEIYLLLYYALKCLEREVNTLLSCNANNQEIREQLKRYISARAQTLVILTTTYCIQVVQLEEKYSGPSAKEKVSTNIPRLTSAKISSLFEQSIKLLILLIPLLRKSVTAIIEWDDVPPSASLMKHALGNIHSNLVSISFQQLVSQIKENKSTCIENLNNKLLSYFHYEIEQFYNFLTL